MNTQRQPPIFIIEGTGFLVDVEKQVLRQTNHAQNEISFITQMQDHGSHYRLLYDPDQRNAAGDASDNTRIKIIDIPRLAELDPKGMSEKYGIPVKQLAGKTDFEIMVDQEALALRRKGVLPQIDLAGERFIIDVRLHELRHAQHFFPVISLKNLELTDDGWHYECFYHPLLKQPVPLDPELTEFPDHVVKLRLPNELILDPVGTARHYAMDEQRLLRRYPIQKELKAEVIPLSETNIPGMIQRNREKLRRDHEEVAKRIRPRNRPRF